MIGWQLRKLPRRSQAASTRMASPAPSASLLDTEKIRATARRAAYAQPRVLLAGMALTVTATTLLAVAQRQNSKSLVSPKSVVTSTGAVPPAKGKHDHMPYHWSDLSRLINEYGQHRALAAQEGKALPMGAFRASDLTSRASSVTVKRYPLTEVDLTGGNRSDEREPVYRPVGGDFIAFRSNGADTTGAGRINNINANRRYHIWVMRRDGSQQRQLTGFGADSARDQTSPTWSPDGNQLVYVDGATPATTQLYVVRFTPLASPQPTPTPGPTPASGTGLPSGVNQPTQITFFGGEKRTPAWSPSGTTIAFAANAAPSGNNSSTPLPGGEFDIFTIAPSGATATIRRLTGDTDGLPGTNPTDTDPNDLVGNQTDDLSPAYSLVNPAVMFFSSNRENGRKLTTGRRIYAMDAFTGANKIQVTFPTVRTAGSVNDIDEHPSLSLTRTFPAGTFNARPVRFTERLAFQSNSLIDATDKTRDFNILSLAVNTTNATTFLTSTIQDEVAGAAVVETNRLASPSAGRAAGFPGATEDKANDIEPSFSRSAATPQLIEPIAFASQRRTAGAPSSIPGSPIPVVVNPGGSNGAGGTYDIWTTNVQDFTPPELIPVSVGNQLYPFLAPGPQAPFFAPRTPEQGLQPNGKLVIACVIREQESGLQTVTASFSDADRPNYTTQVYSPNDLVSVEVAQERPPQTVVNSQTLQVYDDGPVSQGGHERQANAVKGDGIYYCQASVQAVDDSGSPLSGDFYISLAVNDNSGNGLIYDNVFGFSTRAFAKRNGQLFVSDYTVGQEFPRLLTSDPTRPATIDTPTESYYLTNPGGTILDKTTGLPSLAPIDEDPPAVDGAADTTTFNRVDIWRVLTRGQVPTEVLNLYTPTTTDQLDPTVDPNGDGVPGPFLNAAGQPITRKVTVAENAVIWASPYTSDVFAAPGTLFDAEMQRRLTNLLQAGGRLFVTGQDVAFALSNAGTQNNDFLQTELRANWTGEVQSFPSTIPGNPNDGYIVNHQPPGTSLCGVGTPPLTLELPMPPDTTPKDYGDACHFLIGQGSGVAGTFSSNSNQQYPDIISAGKGGAGEDITTLYTYGGGIAAQRIVKPNRNNTSIESRAVFFAFGLEGINRKYVRPANCRDVCVNYRSKLADNIVQFLETGRVSGTVTNAATNLPVANFLIAVTLGGVQKTPLFLARTDANGNYEIAGLPSGLNYSIFPAAYLANGIAVPLNGGYFYNANIQLGRNVRGGQVAQGVDFRVNTVPPATITGRAISDKGTPLNTADDETPAQPAPNLPVLLRSLDVIPASDQFPNGGIFAQLTSTNAFGNFAFDNVPAGTNYEIIFNPKAGFISKGGDIPDNSGLDYGNPNSLLKPSPDFGRRIIPHDPGYPLDYPLAQINPPIGNTLDLGDVAVPPAGQSVNGIVRRANGTGVNGVTVTLSTAGGTVATTTTGSSGTVAGTYTFTGIQPGTYTVSASQAGIGSGRTTVTVTTGNNVTASTITLTGSGVTPTPGGPTPTPGPGTTPTPVPTPTAVDFQVGQTYQISVPYMDSSAPNATTTPTRAFNVPPTGANGANYTLTRYNPVTQGYETLTNTSTLRRGEGYFIKPLLTGVSIKRPTDDPTRKPLVGTTFTITLRRNPSISNRDPNSGFNLIGFPFDPAKYRSVDWTQSQFITPSGQRFANLSQAVSNGVVNAELTTLADDGSGSYVSTQTMIPFKGYFARTYVDGLQVVLKASP